ncbi:Fic family protein, partial [Acinetobacter baumannii]
IVWVHPFNDGNGRTSRFIGNLIEEGGSEPDELARQTASSGARGTIYKVKYVSREQTLKDVDSQDLMLSDEEREELRQGIDTLPN